MNNAALARRTKEQTKTARRSVCEATVLFADISGFVALSRQLGDAETFDLLDRLFTAFDALCEWHGVEKVKTIGDGYMAVAGVRAGQTNHAERAARLAIDMQQAALEIGDALGLELALRIGMASGPVTTGKMGLGNQNFDIWGETVNLASRLEGQANRNILVSDELKALIDDRFEFEACEKFDIRGFGSTIAWTLVDEKTSESAWPCVDGFSRQHTQQQTAYGTF
ncbi:MAG: hypothetical protein RLZ98_2139 [Pseudomonadota bacterium]|jgi:adenylate cyclase